MARFPLSVDNSPEPRSRPLEVMRAIWAAVSELNQQEHMGGFRVIDGAELDAAITRSRLR